MCMFSFILVNRVLYAISKAALLNRLIHVSLEPIICYKRIWELDLLRW